MIKSALPDPANVQIAEKPFVREAMSTINRTPLGKIISSRMVCFLFVFCAAMAIASPAQTFTTLVNFHGPDGATPRYGSLVQDTDGNFYGTTRGGGAHSLGTVFKMTPSGTLTTLYSFCSQPGCSDGSDPDAGLALGSDGDFYGVTTAGGANGDGAVFKITASGTFTSLHSFVGSDGYGPAGTLLLASDGNFYGTTNAEGGHGSGTVFKITPNGTLTTIYNFCSVSICADGATPFAGLVQGTDGNFYGTTSSGGSGVLYGTVFKITPNGVLTTLHSFTGSDGSAPYGKLVWASDGHFYGTTSSGGTSQKCSFGCGTVFKITPSGDFASLHSFNFTDGSYVIAGLTQGGDGNFYGTTGYGGSTQNCGNGCGTIFSITPGGTLTTLHSFAGFPADGSLPVSGLLQAGDSTFYGTAEAGGTVGDGTVFSVSPDDLLTVTVVGSGTVISGGIYCGTVCSHLYPPGTRVRLTAIPGQSSTLGSWAGCDIMQAELQDDFCTVTMSGARNVTATFTGVQVTLISLTLKPATVRGGQLSVGTLTIGAAAPPGGVGIAITSDHPRVAHPPSLVVVPGGATSTSFVVRTVPHQETVAKITASANTSHTSATLTVKPR